MVTFVRRASQDSKNTRPTKWTDLHRHPDRSVRIFSPKSEDRTCIYFLGLVSCALGITIFVLMFMMALWFGFQEDARAESGAPSVDAAGDAIEDVSLEPLELPAPDYHSAAAHATASVPRRPPRRLLAEPAWAAAADVNLPTAEPDDRSWLVTAAAAGLASVAEHANDLATARWVGKPDEWLASLSALGDGARSSRLRGLPDDGHAHARPRRRRRRRRDRG